MLTVPLRLTDSDYPFDIFKLFLKVGHTTDQKQSLAGGVLAYSKWVFRLIIQLRATSIWPWSLKEETSAIVGTKANITLSKTPLWWFQNKHNAN